MLYFLILLIPFTLAIGYLFYRNQKLGAKFGVLASEALALNRETCAISNEKLRTLKMEYLITDDAIKQLEHFVHQLEAAQGKGKSKSFANTYISRMEKLVQIEKKLAILKN